MTDKDRKPVDPIAAVGAVALFCATPIAWAWTSDWRWAITAAGVGLALVVVASTRAKGNR